VTHVEEVEYVSKTRERERETERERERERDSVCAVLYINI
jgi:hypothetical protein